MQQSGVTSRTTAPDHDHVLVEHREIKELLETMEGSSELPVLQTAVRRLDQLLMTHFAREERPDGLFDHIMTEAPRYQKTVAQLRSEHQQMLRMLQELVGEVDVSVCVDVLREHSVALVHKLRNHDKTETTLFLDAIYTDLGEGD